MNDFNCGSGPSPISERLTIFKEIVRISMEKEERTIVDDFTYQNVRVVELVAILNYIIALYNFGLPVNDLYSIIEVYEEVKSKPGSCYFYILEFIESNFKSIHTVLLMLDHFTKEIYDLLKDEGQMIGKFQFYVMAKAIASYKVHTQDVINNLADRLNQYNKELTPKPERLSASSVSTLVSNNLLVSNPDMDEIITEDIEINNNNHNISNSSSITSSIRTLDNNRSSLIKEESGDDDTLIENMESENTTTSIPSSTTPGKTNTLSSVNLDLKRTDAEEIYKLNIEKKSMIYECITSLNVYSKFSNLKFDIPSYPSDELIEKIESC